MIRGRDQALKHRYIQPNPPGLVGWLVFDVDRPLAVLAWEWNEVNLPPPNITAMNPANDHAHLFYALAAPVCTSPAAHSHPLRYAAAIEAAYRARLRADPGYSGLIAKNPLRGGLLACPQLLYSPLWAWRAGRPRPNSRVTSRHLK